MIQTKNTIIINKDIDKVFEIATDFERYPEFIPTYKKVKIIEKNADNIIIERSGMAGGKEITWRSLVKLEKNKSITAEQLAGPIPGMKIEWLFEEVGNTTKITLIHNFEYKKIPLIGPIIGKFIVAKIVYKMADDTLKAIKNRVEAR
ncbi:MAG: SRPBCC family protein [bacterium]